MLREHLFHKQNTSDPMFRWRGGAISRMEGLSDGVFALTLTLIVMRVEVPETFHDLWRTAYELPIFLACFALLMMAWRYHCLFFRRYGLDDTVTTLLNAGYLFLIIFLAFPLQFLATFLYQLATGQGTEAMFALPADGSFAMSDLEQRCAMMNFYGWALIGVFGLQALMLAWAWLQRERLELDRLERAVTLSSIGAQLITVGVATLSVIIVAVYQNPGWAGICYFLMPLLHPAYGIINGTRLGRMYQAMQEQAAAGDPD